MPVEHRALKGDGDMIEAQHAAVGAGGEGFRLLDRGCEARHASGNNPMSSLVRNRSLTTISTEAATMAWVVARPTPCVPPLADQP